MGDAVEQGGSHSSREPKTYRNRNKPHRFACSLPASPVAKASVAKNAAAANHFRIMHPRSGDD
jgi:hypothetical protein